MAVVLKPRPLTRMRRPLFVVGVALALVAFVVMFAVGMLFNNRAQGGEASVVVASQDIQSRAPIDAGMIAVRQLPAGAVPPRSFVRVADLTGYSAVVSILKGQVITGNLVAQNPDLISSATSAYLPIPQGYVAMTMPANEQQSVAGYVADGDYINVIATANTSQFSPKNPRMVTRTVFTNVFVIRVGPPSAASKQGQVQGLASSVTVVLSQCDAQFMDWLILNTSLKYSLLSYHDYGPNPLAAPDPTCPPTGKPGAVGPAQVDARWEFSKS